MKRAVVCLALALPGLACVSSTLVVPKKIAHGDLDWLAEPPGKLLTLSTERADYVGGDEIRIRVLSDRKPVWEPTEEDGHGAVHGVLVSLAGNTRATDEEGWATLPAPLSEFPMTYEITARKAGYAALDAHSVDGRTLYAPSSLMVTVLLPAGIAFSLPPDVKERLKRIRILDTTWLSDIAKKALAQKLADSGIDIDEDSGWDEEDILDDLAEAGWDDIWVFHGHAGDTDGDGANDAIGDDDDNAMTAAELCQALARDQDPPSIIVLSGCATASLAQRLCACGAKIVVGYDKTCYSGNGASAAEKLIEALLDGKTLRESAGVASGALNGSDGPGTVTICQGGGSSVELDTARLGDALYRKPSTTTLTTFTMQPSQDQSSYETLLKARLTDANGNVLAGRAMVFTILCELENQSRVYFLEASIGSTGADGIADSTLWRIARPPASTLTCRAEATFEGDAEYAASRDQDSRTVP
jgi:hypothetical protein